MFASCLRPAPIEFGHMLGCGASYSVPDKRVPKQHSSLFCWLSPRILGKILGQNNKVTDFLLDTLIVFAKMLCENSEFSEIFLYRTPEVWGAKGMAKVLEHSATKKLALLIEKVASRPPATSRTGGLEPDKQPRCPQDDRCKSS